MLELALQANLLAQIDSKPFASEAGSYTEYMSVVVQDYARLLGLALQRISFGKYFKVRILKLEK